MQQLDIFNPLAPTNTPNHARGASLEEQFAAFHAANPHVYHALRRLALDMTRRGQRRIGIGMLFEVLRWQYVMATHDPNGFKLNNNYRSFYARLLHDNEPELHGVFEMRQQTWQTYEVN